MASSFRMTFFFMSNVRYIPDSKHDGSKWSLHSAENDVGPDHFALVILTFAAHNRLYLGSAGNRCRLTPSLVVLLHPAAIHLVGIVGKMPEKCLFLITKQTYRLTTCTCVNTDKVEGVEV